MEQHISITVSEKVLENNKTNPQDYAIIEFFLPIRRSFNDTLRAIENLNGIKSAPHDV